MISGKADCGLRSAVKKSGSAVGYCALSIKCGTRDEEGYPSGIAHFVEHTIFKGTEKKSASVINGYLDRLGGELNAFTTKEEIVFHATVLKEDLAKAVDEGVIAGAGLDVYVTEPLPADNCFLKMSHPERMSLAPHVGWASQQARERLMAQVAENIRNTMLK